MVAPHASLDSPLGRVLALGGLRALYQPVVELETAAVVAYEALARGPEGSELQRPDLLFQAARREGRLGELAWRCRQVAYEGALDARLSPPTGLFVNVEPETLGIPAPRGAEKARERAREELRVVHELTERGIVLRPAEMLRAVEDLRGQGWGIAVDDLGSDWGSLALLPFIRPDVVKLDRRLINGAHEERAERIGRAVRAYAEWSGATIVAEGVETPLHIDRALALGATLGQGYLFGRAAPLEAVAARPRPQAELAFGEPQPAIDDESPVEVVERALPMDVATKAELLAMSIDLERRTLDSDDPAVVLGTFQSAAHFTTPTARRYSALARRSAFVGAFGTGMPARPAPGVRGASMPDNHRLAGEWNVICVGPHFAGAVIAADLGDDGPEMERRFKFVNTRDRDLVVRAGRALMLKVTGLGTNGDALAA
jgi:EAL domain-containing protein (putative c-di-GMP-specific phosphodiesterase class I)